MFWKKGPKFLRTTTARLTVWYLAVFCALSIAVFLIVYVFLALRLQDQTDYELLNESKEFSILYKEHGIKVLQSEFKREAESQGTGQVFFQLLTADGKTRVSSDPVKWEGIDISRPDHLSINPSHLSYRTLLLPRQEYKVRVLTMPVSATEMLEVGILLRYEQSILRRYLKTFGIAMMIMVSCGGVFGFFLAKKAMNGVQKVTETAISIGKSGLGRRVAMTGEGAEIDALVEAFNGMLERIEGLLVEFRQVTDNVAHELRTPITRIRGIAETTLKGEDDLAEYKDMTASVIHGCDDLIEMISTMLEIAQTDSGAVMPEMKVLNLYGVVEEAVDLFSPVTEDKGIDLRLKTLSKLALINGDRRRLQRVVANLVDNAIKYTPQGGMITITISMNPEQVKVEIADTGIGIDQDDIPHIFERFYRGDKSRSTAGNGLGLALVQAVICAHHGNISAESSVNGSIFSFVLPKAQSCCDLC